MIASLLQDLRYACRGLLRRPLFVLVAALSLGLGIGVNTAIYSLFHQAVLRPLPVSAPERLVNLSAPGIKRGSTSNNSAGPRDAIFSYPMFRDLEAAPEVQQALSGLAAHRSIPVSLTLEGQAHDAAGMLVSGNYFDVLGLKPRLGRLLRSDDDTTPGAGRVAVLGHAYWMNTLGGDPGVLGRTLRVNGEALEIVGIAPEGFDGTTFGTRAQVFVPITLRWLLQSTEPPDHDDRRSYWVYLFGRLAPGVGEAQAGEALDRPYTAALREEVALQWELDEAQQVQFLARRIALSPGARGQSSESESMRVPLLLLLAAAGLVLVVACLNIANLLLAHGAARAGEFALRSSIGASRGRLLRQLLIESTLLAVAGALLALPLASLSLHGLLALLPGGGLVRADAALQPASLGFAAVLAAATIMLFGLFPALHTAAASPMNVLRGSSGTGSRAAWRFRNGLATGQMALSMATLALAGLLAQSLHNLARVDLGMRAESVAAFYVSPGRIGYSPERAAVLFDRLEEELATLPGVEAVGLSLVPLFTNSNWGSNVSVEGFEPGADALNPRYNYIGEGYFEALGIPLLAGRSFARADNAQSAKVAVVNRRFAEYHGLGENPVGMRMAIGNGDKLDIEIVGLVADSHYSAVREIPPMQFYLPRRQVSQLTEANFYVRAHGDPKALLSVLPEAVARIDPQLPVVDLRTLPQTIAENLASERFVGTLAMAFAVLATALAALGLYGVLSFTLAQRRRELGLRLALGAEPARLARMLLAQVTRMTVAGIGIGVVAALALGRAAQSLLFGLDGHAPGVLLAAAALLALVALSASLAPARRAARTDPMHALRYEG